MVRAHAPGTLILVGDGQERLHLEQLASATAPGRIRFTGERPDARRLLPAFDVVVVPSLEREGLGLAALEAMDAARPVIASRVGGLVEVVEDGRTGLLVEPGSVEAILAALRTILERPGLGHAFGEESRRRVDSTFRAATMARRVEALYEEVLGVRRAA
jgi:glycosyltransferase involved in cell wall biosynthesis